MRVKKGNPMFSVGDTVYAPGFTGEMPLVVEASRHNGLVWMYDFVGRSERMGEDYLFRTIPEKSLRELVVEHIFTIKSYDGFLLNYKLEDVTFKQIHVSDVNYTELGNKDLFKFYNLILSKHFSTSSY